MFGLFKRRRRNRLRVAPFPSDWLRIIEKNVRFYAGLPESDRLELHGLIQIFLAEKVLEGCGGLALTDEIRVTIAAQACLLLLHRDTDIYPKLTTVLVYPSAYVAKAIKPVGSGLVLEGEIVNLGESWTNGIVVLSWDEIRAGASDLRDHRNLVVHEFAHQLDREDGAIDGAPLLDQRSQYVAWARVLNAEYERLKRDSWAGRPTVLDEYGTTDPAEFFAVATECFFEKPKALESATSRAIRRIEVLLSARSRETLNGLSLVLTMVWFRHSARQDSCLIICTRITASLLQDDPMQIRSYQPGDELPQTRIYNTAAAALPGFKPGKTEEVARRIHAGDFDPHAMFYATDNGEVVGYEVFGSSGRISAPWCLPGAESVQKPLLETTLAEMKKRGLPEAWAAYRADWSPVLDILRGQNFAQNRSMINYVAETSRLPAHDRLPSNRIVAPLNRNELHHLAALTPALFGERDIRALEQFFWENPFYSFPDRFLALREAESGAIRAVSLLVVDDRFGDPTKIDPSIPCFRFGAFGTEHQRHKRVNALFSCLFVDAHDGDMLLTASLTNLHSTFTLTHLAAQAPSDAPSLCAWYDRFFNRQGSFPVFSRRLLP